MVPGRRPWVSECRGPARSPAFAGEEPQVRQGAARDAIQVFQGLVVQPQGPGREVVLELLGGPWADDRACHARLSQRPGDGDGRVRRAEPGRDLADLVDDLEVLVR